MLYGHLNETKKNYQKYTLKGQLVENKAREPREDNGMTIQLNGHNFILDP